MEEKKIILVVIFSLTYLGLAFGSIPGLLIDRAGISLIGSALIILFGIMTTHEALEHIDISTILLLYGLMVLSAQLRIGGFYTKVALLIMKNLKSPKILLLQVMIASAILSAVLANDIVCLAFTPVVAYSTLKSGINPVPFLIALAVSSNIGSASTIVGNPQNMFIGQFAKLDFLDFLLWCSPPSILSLATSYLIILAIFRKKWNLSGDKIQIPEKIWDEFNKHHSIKGLIFVVITILLFFTPIPREIVATTAASLLMISRYISTRRLLELVDWSLIILFICLFIIVGAVSKYQIPQEMLSAVGKYGLNINAPIHLSITTVIISNIFSNVPAVMLLINTLDKTTENYYILAVSSTFAGNLLTIGSIANLIVIEQAKNFGIKITFLEYAKAGIPITLVSIIILLIWIRI